MDKITLMERLGLTKIEAKVYIDLLKLGSTTTGPLVKKSELHRATVYDVLKRLMEKGLVTYITKQKTKYFQATDPERLMDFISNEEEKIKQKKEDTKKLVQELETVKQQALHTEEARVFVGKTSVKAIYNLILEYPENWTFGSHGRARQILGEFFNNFRKIKIKRKIKTKLIVSERMRHTDIGDPKWGEVKFLPKEFDSPTATVIFGNNVAIIVWTENPIGFLIESKDAAEAFKNYFNVIWNHVAKK